MLKIFNLKNLKKKHQNHAIVLINAKCHRIFHFFSLSLLLSLCQSWLNVYAQCMQRHFTFDTIVKRKYIQRTVLLRVLQLKIIHSCEFEKPLHEPKTPLTL